MGDGHVHAQQPARTKCTKTCSSSTLTWGTAAGHRASEDMGIKQPSTQTDESEGAMDGVVVLRTPQEGGQPPPDPPPVTQ